MNPKKVDQLEIRTVGGEVLVHDVATGKVHVLNEVAGRVLELCDGSRSAQAIAEDIAGATGEDIAIVGPDVDAVLEQFASFELLLKN